MQPDPRDVDALVERTTLYERMTGLALRQKTVGELADLVVRHATTITALQADVAALREALRTYAGPLDDTWNEKPYPYWADGYPGGVFIADNTLDFGETARAALGQQP